MTFLTKTVPLAIAAGLVAAACGSGTAAAPPAGALTGRLIIEGGTSAHYQPRPLTGTIRFIQHGRVVATVETRADGSFTQSLGPGAYQVRACTSKIQTVEPNGTHVDACSPDVRATVSANHTTDVHLLAFIVP